MKHLSQIGTSSHSAPPMATRLRSFGRRVRWGYVAWFITFVVTASIALYAVRSLAGALNGMSAQ